ncbi:MAG TPA: ATP-binding cassette domain-containing protein [Bacteroidetes bacterium]|nr:ATP-binding cassette domain-containing protein [Bacteroidota bacterium]
MKTFPRLLRLALPFRSQMALAVGLGFLTVGSSVGLLATSAYLISAAALHPSIAELQVAIVGVRFFGISRGVFRYLERLVSHNATFRLLEHLRVWFYRALEPLAPARLARYKTGDLHARIVNDIETLETFFLRVLAPPVVAVLTAAAMGLLAWTFHPLLGVAVAVLLVGAGVGLVGVTYGLQKHTGPNLVRSRSQLRSLLVDSVGGIADLTAFGATRRLFDRVRTASLRVAGGQRRANLSEAVENSLGVLAANGAAWVVLLLALRLADQEVFEPLYLAALTLATLASFEAVFPLPQAAHSLNENLEAGSRLFEIVDSEPAAVDPPEPLPAPRGEKLDVQDLTFSYDRNLPPALDGVSFSISRNASLAVVGPSGAGKSTLVNLLLRFWDVPLPPSTWTAKTSAATARRTCDAASAWCRRAVTCST